jgi:polyphenol oxidase
MTLPAISTHSPRLVSVEQDGVVCWTDEQLRERAGVVVAFTERGGGTSRAPFASLNLAAHVGDDPSAVDANRTRVLESLGLLDFRNALCTAEQVHGCSTAVVSGEMAGAGSWASYGRAPIASTDALLTTRPAVPLLMCFADCVPVLLVAPGPAVGVVHAGWRGALCGLAGIAARNLAEVAKCHASQLLAYIGPHIGSCCYETDQRILSQFVNTFGTVARADSGCLNLGAVVQQSLTDAGVSTCRTTSLGRCTYEETDRFFSHRAERGLTGRHGAVGCILPSSSS